MASLFGSALQARSIDMQMFRDVPASDPSFRFDDLCILLERLGFTEHRRPGSHRIFTRADIVEILNLQPWRRGEAVPRSPGS